MIRIIREGIIALLASTVTPVTGADIDPLFIVVMFMMNGAACNYSGSYGYNNDSSCFSYLPIYRFVRFRGRMGGRGSRVGSVSSSFRANGDGEFIMDPMAS